MCGIAGFINFNNVETIAASANKVQQHRGPDSQAYWIEGNVCLTHQRLSIIDLESRSNQPFDKGNLVMIFNGEIYNYQELKAALLEQDPTIRFTTTSDTEVLLELYRVKKEKCLEEAIGMFAFAILEKDTGKLFIARDQFGIKPVFYTQIGNSFAFSSELKTLVNLPGFNKTIDYRALVGSINYLWVPGNVSLFQDTHKLGAASYVQIDTRSAILKPVFQQYWSLPRQDIPAMTENECIDQVRTCMEESVARHMIADVPVSCFLSGGLDSSLISVLAKQHTDRLSTYTIGTSQSDKQTEQMPDDERYAGQLARLHHFEHHEIIIEADIVRDLPAMVYTLDEPIGDPAALNTYLICKAARERGVRVLLSGMGADELFFGYRRQKATLMAMRYKKIPAPVRKLIAALIKLLPVKVGDKGLRIFRWAKRFQSFADLSAEESYMRSYSYYNQRELQGLFKENIDASYEWLRDQHKGYFNEKADQGPINQMCNTDIHMFMQGLNLTYTDRASMAASVEVRVPFIDRKVVELAMRIPPQFKYQQGQSKYILKKVAEKYLPHDIIYRPKASFGAPIRSWISRDLKPMIDDLLSATSVNKRGIFHYDYVKKMIDDDRSGKEDNAYRIYQLITLELWFRNFLD